jgi:hypothetical protein
MNMMAISDIVDAQSGDHLIYWLICFTKHAKALFGMAEYVASESGTKKWGRMNCTVGSQRQSVRKSTI